MSDQDKLLLPYQTRWVRDRAKFAVIEKSRRIGISWAEAYESTMHAGVEGRGNVFYQSFNQDMTQTFIKDCAWWAEQLNCGIKIAQETILTNEREQVLRFRVTFDNGKEIHALPSNPRVLRSKGRPGDRYVLDEAAFCDDLNELLKAATALTQWGGIVRIISTHNGAASPFNQLVMEIREGKHEQYALHRVTLDDAINEGLAKRVYQITERKWHAAANAEWRAEVIGAYTDQEAADEELFCIPRQSGGAWLQWQWIRQAEHADAAVPHHYQKGLTYIGIDIARRNDLWVAVVLEHVGDVLWLRELRAEKSISFAEQAGIVDAMVKHYCPVRIIVDQTGMGEAVVEQLQERHGRYRVEGVLLSAPRRLDVATALREVLEDNRLRIPADDALRRDLHSIKAETTLTGAPRLVAERSGTDGHADRFWALALAASAAAVSNTHQPYEYTPVRSRPLRDDDDDDHDLPGGQWDRVPGRARFGPGVYG